MAGNPPEPGIGTCPILDTDLLGVSEYECNQLRQLGGIRCEGEPLPGGQLGYGTELQYEGDRSMRWGP
jgi:hypothetical protein